ncbi:MAG: EamA family transporter [Ruminococcaceae bacterium]|nr:EamA family transporter [Oscillospiraceae bacterium]
MKTLLNKKSFNIFLIALAGALWGCIGLFTTPLKENRIDSISIIAVRSTLTAIMLGLLLLFYNKRLFKIKLRDLWRFAGMGIVSFAFFNICYLKSMELNNSLGTACILMYTAPIFIMLLSAILFKEKITPTKIICLILAVVGCTLISGGGSVTPLGFIFGIGSGLGYGLYSIFSVYALRKYSFWTATFYAFCFSALALIPFCNWKNVIIAVSTDINTAPLFLGLAIVITVLPYIIYTCGLKKVPASEASVIACVEPIVAALVGLIFYDQTMGILGITGMLLILTAVVILSYKM